MKVMVSLCKQNGPPAPPKPLHKPWFICRYIATVQFFAWVMLFETQLAFVYCLPCISLWVEISTLAYEANKNCWAERLSVAYSTHKTNALKLEISTKINVYSYGRPHRHASCSAEVICRGCGVVTCNTQPSTYQKHLGHPQIAGILYNRHTVALDLFCCHCRRRSYLSHITFLQLCHHTEECK
jgi:hypothetical protein